MSITVSQPCRSRIPEPIQRVIRWRCPRPLFSSIPIALLLVGAVGLVVHRIARESQEQDTPSPAVQWATDLYRYSEDDEKQPHRQCPQTKIYPFEDGCPQTCEGLRKDIKNSSELFHFDAVFYFGETNRYQFVDGDGGARAPLPPPTVYEKGINFECNEDLVYNFATAGEYVRSTLGSITTSTTQNATGRSGSTSSSNGTTTVVVRIPNYIHMTLSYVCCLTQNETDWARQITRQWIMDTYPFDFPMRFDHTRCVDARPNTWGIMLVADEATQRHLMKLNHQLRDRLEADGRVPVVVSRESQMEFHISLAAIRGNQSDLGTVVQQVTEKLSREHGNQWTGEGPTWVSNWPRITDSRMHQS